MSQQIGTLPVLPVPDVAAAIDHYVDVLGFTEVMRVPGEGGAIAIGQVQRAGCHVMFNLNPKDAAASGGGIWIWIRDNDADIDGLYEQLVDRGLTIREELGDRFWGDRSFTIEDLNGYPIAFNKALKT